jgi:Immunity protein 8
MAPSGFSFRLLSAPSDGPGEESFDFMLCTPEWFASNMTDEIMWGRHYAFMKRYNYAELERRVRDYCASCQGESWNEVALKVARVGHWEFEDYDPRPRGLN